MHNITNGAYRDVCMIFSEGEDDAAFTQNCYFEGQKRVQREKDYLFFPPAKACLEYTPKEYGGPYFNPCNPANLAQQWEWLDDFTFRNKDSRACLRPVEDDLERGITRVGEVKCNGTDLFQQWYVEGDLDL